MIVMQNIKEIKAFLKKAIQQSRVIEFHYHGGVRRVEPYAFGIHKITRNEVLSAYQVGGYSRSKKTLRWRLYLLTKIKELRITDESFDSANRPAYTSKNDPRMSLVYFNIK
jgi:hypothetical protein